MVLAGFSRIELRSPTGGVPWMDGGDDAYVDGQRLYDTVASASWTVYRLEQDDRRDFVFDGSTNTWKATRDGWTWTWGSTSATTCAVERQDEDASWDCATDFGGDNLAADETTAWLLSRVEDPFGNTIEYAYTTGSGSVASFYEGAATHALEHVPASILYAAGYHRVDFGWEARPDTPTSARSGVLRASPLRLSGIDITSNVGGIEAGRDADAPGASYAIAYADADTVACEGESAIDLAAAAASGLSLVHRVIRLPDGAAWTGTNGRALRCIERSSSEASFALATASPFSGAHVYAPTLFSHRHASSPTWPSSTHLAASLDGDALADLLHFSSQCQGGGAPGGREQVSGCAAEWQYFRNDGGLFTGATSDPSTPAAAGWLAANVDGSFLNDGGAWVLLDLGRDGIDDAVVATTGVGDDRADGVILAADAYLEWLEDEALDLDPLDEGAGGELLRHRQWADIDGDGLVDLVLPPPTSTSRRWSSSTAPRASPPGCGTAARRPSSTCRSGCRCPRRWRPTRRRSPRTGRRCSRPATTAAARRAGSRARPSARACPSAQTRSRTPRGGTTASRRPSARCSTRASSTPARPSTWPGRRAGATTMATAWPTWPTRSGVAGTSRARWMPTRPPLATRTPRSSTATGRGPSSTRERARARRSCPGTTTRCRRGPRRSRPTGSSATTPRKSPRPSGPPTSRGAVAAGSCSPMAREATAAWKSGPTSVSRRATPGAARACRRRCCRSRSRRRPTTSSSATGTATGAFRGGNRSPRFPLPGRPLRPPACLRPPASSVLVARPTWPSPPPGPAAPAGDPPRSTAPGAASRGSSTR